MQPNILFLTWHDAGRWFGCYGNENVHTPNVDRIAAEGVRFTNIISACAICSPSRAAIMTGHYCQRNGVMSLANTVFQNRIHPHVKHFAVRMKEAGYHTALFGVEHEAAHEHVQDVLQVDEQFNTDPWPEAGVSADAFCRWLDARPKDGKPFYAQIGFHEAHLGSWLAGEEKEHYPYAHDEEGGLHIPPHIEDTPYGRETIATLQGYLRRGDEAIGRMLDALAKHGIERDTLVIMCGDHGPGISRAKTTCYDPGISVAWLMRWPGVIEAGTTVDALAAHVDTLPTLLELLDMPVPPECQGQSLAGHVRGERSDEVNDAVFSHMVENVRSIRTSRYKLIRNFREPGVYAPGPIRIDVLRKRDRAPRPDHAASHVELYDLEADPNEFHNLADDPGAAETLADLDGRLWDFLLEQGDFLVNDPVRTPWQQHTRAALEAHCANRNRPCPPAVGPLA
jgi:N-sulfoglucosamine sulfohydrolase